MTKNNEEEIIDLSEGYDNIYTQKRIGMFYMPKIVIIQKPDIAISVMNGFIPIEIEMSGAFGDSVFYTGISANFDVNVSDNVQIYDVKIKKDGGVEFLKTDKEPSFVIELDDKAGEPNV